jgi:phosphonate transport system substrate-binding protein
MKGAKHFVRSCALAAAATLALAVGSANVRAETLVIGSVGKDVKTEFKHFTPLAKYLEKELSSAGIDKVEVLVVPTAARMVEAFRAGQVHLYPESPLVAAKVARDTGAVPLVRRWRKGLGEYWSEIIVNSEAPIHTLEDLRGKVIAFEDPDSTSGHLLPRAMLLERGLKIQTLKKHDDPVAPDSIGAIFTLGDRSSILSLLDGRVAAIATDPHYVTMVEKERPGAVRSIARSITVPRQVVMRAGTMPEALAQKITDVLLAMEQGEEGREVLKAFGKTDRFEAFPDRPEATFEALQGKLRLLDADPALTPPTQ